MLGNLGDRTGHRRILIASAVVAAASYLPMAFVTEGWQLLVLNALSGIATGGLMPALSAMLVRFTPEEEVGSAFGLDNSVMSAARAVSPLLAVGAAELFGYQSVFFLGALIFLVTLFLTIWKLPDPKRSRKPRELTPGA
jgi:DHA1 family multidrug resistance protein-like MFS transporter